MVSQSSLKLPHFSRGVHLITEYINEVEIVISSGIINIFLQHTSASLAINENYDPAVRIDTENFLKKLVPDGWNGFTHTLEGADDMPAHLKNILIGSSLTIPVRNSSPALGTWQGIYLLEHRESGANRSLLITQIGE